MHNRKVARRYAQALFELTERDHQTVAERLFEFSRLVAGSTELRHMLLSPAFRMEERRQAMRRLVAQLKWGAPLDRFLELLVENRRLDVVGDIADIFMEMTDQKLGRVRARIASAVTLSPEEQAALRAAIAQALGKEVALEAQIEAQLLAGLKVQVGDLTLDGSLRHKLDALKEKLLQTRA